MNDPVPVSDTKRPLSHILLLVLLCSTMTGIGVLVFCVRQARPLIPVYEHPAFDCVAFIKSVASASKLTVPRFGGHGHARNGAFGGYSHHVWSGTLVGSKADLTTFEAASKKALEDEFRRRGSTVINPGSGHGEFTFQLRTGLTETYWEVFLSEIIEDPGSKTVSPHHRRQIFLAIHEY